MQKSPSKGGKLKFQMGGGEGVPIPACVGFCCLSIERNGLILMSKTCLKLIDTISLEGKIFKNQNCTSSINVLINLKKKILKQRLM